MKIFDFKGRRFLYFATDKYIKQKTTMKKILLTVLLMGWAGAVMAQDSMEIAEPEIFTMEQGDTTYVMQKYFMVFLKSGPKRSQTKEEAMEIQEKHLAYLQKMAEQGKTSITGPMDDAGEIRGIVIYNTATAEEARTLAEGDPAVQEGRLVVEVHPWWAAKGSMLK